MSSMSKFRVTFRFTVNAKNASNQIAEIGISVLGFDAADATKNANYSIEGIMSGIPEEYRPRVTGVSVFESVY